MDDLQDLIQADMQAYVDSQDEDSSLKDTEQAPEQTAETVTEDTTDQKVAEEAALQETVETTPPLETEGGVTSLDAQLDTAEEDRMAEQSMRETIKAEMEAEYGKRIQELENAEPFANEEIKHLNELAKAGIDVNSEDFWKWQALDINKFDPTNKEDALEMIRLELEIENTDLTPNEINRIIKKRHKDLFSGYYEQGDTEYQEAETDLSIEAKRARTKLIKHKDSVQLPKVDIREKEQRQAEDKKANDEFLLHAKQQVNSYIKEPIALQDGLEIDHIISPETKKYVESSIVNSGTWIRDNYVTEQGVDLVKYQRDMARLHDFDKIISVVFEQGKSVGLETAHDNLENASEESQNSKVETSKSINDQIHEQFVAQNSR
jgi:hypothetical protein